MQLNRHRVLPIILILVTIATDQGTKFIAGKLLNNSETISFFYDIFSFSLVQNFGGFLGIVSAYPENIRFLLLNICVSFLLIACLLYLLTGKERQSHNIISLAFVTGGGMSNLIDRLLHNGGVIDFLSVGIGNFRTGIFNLADIYILTGSFILGYTLFSSLQKPGQPPAIDS